MHKRFYNKTQFRHISFI